MPPKFYNLPPAYNPGYADPEYIKDEGLRRRAFTTRMAPRGSYDDPKVGAGGYALPNYIGKEGYGQGAYVTKWAPRGSYAGPRVPSYLDKSAPKPTGERAVGGGAMQVSFAGTDNVGSIAASNPYAQFGWKAAGKIVAQIMRLPPAQRRAAMKAALDNMDPRLFAKADAYAQTYQKQGMAPRPALMQALARAITEGTLAELQRAGATRTAPQVNSLPGLGCYRARGALGALGATERATAGSVLTKAGSLSSQTCAPPAGYTWDAASGGYYRRLKVGEAPAAGPCGGTVTQNTGPKATETAGGTKAGKMLELGPNANEIWFKIPVEDRGVTISTLPPDAFPGGVSSRPMQVPPSLIQAIATQMQKFLSVATGLEKFGVGQGKIVDGAAFGYPGYQIWDKQGNGELSVFSFEHPTAKKRFGLYVKFEGTPQLPKWRVFWKNNEPSGVQGALSQFMSLFARIVDVVAAAVEAVTDLACDLINSPNAAGAAAAASGPAAGVGVGLAQGACGPAAQPQLPVPGVGGMDMNTVVLLGAGALLVVALAKRKKGAKP